MKTQAYSSIKGARFKEAIKKSRIKQIELAERARLNPARLSLILSGSVAVTHDAATRLLGAMKSLGIDITQFKNEPVADYWR